jgi:hypothetical protein
VIHFFVASEEFDMSEYSIKLNIGGDAVAD